MGKNEAASPSKSDKSSLSMQEQPTIHPYPDWAAMQAYYGPGVAMTPPYFGTAVTSGHAPYPYMWHPQPLMTAFGTPYATIYPPALCSHPSMSLGSHAPCQVIAPSLTTGEAVVMAAPLSVETPEKSLSDKDRGLLKKLKGLDGLAVTVTNSYADNTAGATDGLSQSGESGGEGSSDGSDGNNEPKGSKMQRKSSEDMPSSGNDGKAETLAKAIHGGEANATSNVSLGVRVPPANTTEKRVGSIPSSGMTPGMDLRVSTTGEVKAGVAPVTPPANATLRGQSGVPHELWMQDERELKRERRKQSNRESARRSRLRKQVETEELALKVESLSTENTTLRSEINRLIENSQKLTQENSALTSSILKADQNLILAFSSLECQRKVKILDATKWTDISVLQEKLQKSPLKQVEEMPPEGLESEGIQSVGTENFLSKINDSGSTNSTGGRQENPKSKLRQFLDLSPRPDTVAAG